ncbi:hypothetical protein CALCODRAFT_541976, partial [Calocera cornea HHB12733]
MSSACVEPASALHPDESSAQPARSRTFDHNLPQQSSSPIVTEGLADAQHEPLPPQDSGLQGDGTENAITTAPNRDQIALDLEEDSLGNSDGESGSGSTNSETVENDLKSSSRLPVSTLESAGIQMLWIFFQASLSNSMASVGPTYQKIRVAMQTLYVFCVYSALICMAVLKVAALWLAVLCRNARTLLLQSLADEESWMLLLVLFSATAGAGVAWLCMHCTSTRSLHLRLLTAF